ncbi:hypothetical protein PG988_006689 [Apiospora saccharicola]
MPVYGWSRVHQRQRPSARHHNHHEEENEWPSLQHLSITTDFVAPSGRSYYAGEGDVVLGEPDEPDEPDGLGATFSYVDQADIEPTRDPPVSSGSLSYGRLDPATFNPLVIDMAAAVIRMPRLKSCILSMSPSLEMCIDVQCIEAGEKYDWDWEESSDERVPIDRKIGFRLTGVRQWMVGHFDLLAWEVPPELRAKWAEWVGPDGKIEVDVLSD